MIKRITAYRIAFIVFCLLPFLLFAQSNRLTDEKGKLLWQYNQNVTIDVAHQNTLLVTFVFINGPRETAISLRQELFHSQIEWLDTARMPVEREARVEFLTAKLAPNQSIMFKYAIKSKLIDNEFVLEKSAILIMNEDYEIQKEIIPEQRFAKE